LHSLRFDVAVVGAGPAGSAAALTLAAGGARVALVDKAAFPRDKACGDVLGPRAVGILDQLGIKLPEALPLGDVLVAGPSGNLVRMRCKGGYTYPGHALASRRIDLDASLKEAAEEAGATPVDAQIVGTSTEGGVTKLEAADGRTIEAYAVVGADGATSRIAENAGLVDRSRIQWGFAVRTYVDANVALPTIVLWEQTRWSAVPGYGWVFPSPDGGSNAGVGVGTLAERRGSEAVKLLDPFLEHIEGLGLLQGKLGATDRVLGGWLKMGMVGTVPARGNTLLVGDAAGLVNPLQGEGIAQALTSGRAAALAVLSHPGAPAAPYRSALAHAHLRYHQVTSAVQSALITRPRAISAVGRVLTAPGIGRVLAPAWGLYWNELLDGAVPGMERSVATVADRVGRLITRHSANRRWFDEVYGFGSGV
jgi:geranylgeranyl reductase family protein